MAKPRRILKEFALGEISCVDRPAQSGARLAIMKRRDADATADAIMKYVDVGGGSDVWEGAKAFATVLSNREAQRRFWAAQEELWPVLDSLSESIRSIIADKTLSAATKQSMMRTSVDDFLEVVRDRMPEVEAELNKILTDSLAGLTKESKMTDAEVKALQDQVADLTKKLADSTEAVAKAETARADADLIAKMSDGERDAMAKMTDKEKEEWKKLTPEQRKAKMAEKAAGDEVLKTADGQEIRKSVVGESQFAIFKSQEERIAKGAVDLAAANEASAMQTFTKRAETEMAHLPGEPIAKAKLLKAVDKLGDEDKATLKGIIDAAEKMSKAGFAQIGTTGSTEPKAGSVQAEIKKKADDIRKADPKVTEDQAIAKVLDAEPALYDRAEAEKRAAAN